MDARTELSSRKHISTEQPPFDSNADDGSPPWHLIAQALTRIADALDPPPPDVVDGPTVARRLGLTATRVAQMARDGIIPASCVVPGTGDGKPWKFVRSRIEAWIAAR